MNGLDQAQLASLRAMLEQEQAVLQSQQPEGNDAGMNLRPAPETESEASPADNASARIMNDLAQEAIEHRAQRMRIIRYALAKFDDGTYGACESCGEQIGPSRLRARPEARFCIECQTKAEKARK
jgi:DnaK suppressor protein